MSFLIKLIDLCLMIVGAVVAVPIGLLFEKDNHLPRMLWLWDNADHGCDGEDFYAKLTVGWSRYQRCYVWLAIRNPTFNFSKYVIGFVSSGYSKTEGNPATDRDQAEGWYWCRDGWAWEFQYIKAYTLFGYRRCVKFRAGWKIQGKNKGERCQFCFVPNPCSSYTGG